MGKVCQSIGCYAKLEYQIPAIMNKKSFLAGVPPWALSLLTLIALIIFGFLLRVSQLLQYSAVETGFYIFFAIGITVSCFFICREYPKSVWYTPLISNSISILVVIFYPYTNPGSSELIFIGSVFALSVLGAIAGARIGRNRSNQAWKIARLHDIRNTTSQHLIHRLISYIGQ